MFKLCIVSHVCANNFMLYIILSHSHLSITDPSIVSPPSKSHSMLVGVEIGYYVLTTDYFKVLVSDYLA